MKHIHIPTLIMHIILIVFAAITLNDYPDLFLWVSIIVMLAHLALAIECKRSFLPAHALGLGLHFLVQSLGIIRGDSGAFGLGGGGFALFFFDIALVISFAAIALLQLIRCLKHK